MLSTFNFLSACLPAYIAGAKYCGQEKLLHNRPEGAVDPKIAKAVLNLGK